MLLINPSPEATAFLSDGRQPEAWTYCIIEKWFGYPGLQSFSCAVSGFGQRSCLWPSAEDVLAPRRTREKTSGTQGMVWLKLSGKSSL